MTTTTATVTCADFCAERGQHQPDNHCVQANTAIYDLYGNHTNINAYLNQADASVGVYIGSMILLPDDARRMAAALNGAADAADQALDALNRTGR